MIWHHVTAQQAIEQLQTDEQNGLTQAQVWQRQQEHRGDRRVRPFFTHTAQRRTFLRLRVLSWVLIAAVCAVLTVLEILHIRDRQAYSFIPALIVLVTAAVNALAWVVLRRYLQKKGHALVSDAQLTARVLRQGETVLCRADEVVPGDILLLQEGDQVAADARLIEAQGLLCLQQAITGQTEPAAKDAGAVLENIAPLSQRCNMVYASTAVWQGTARAVVTEVGKQMQICSRPASLSRRTEGNTKWFAMMRLPLLVGVSGAAVLLLVGRLCCDQWLMPLLAAAVFAAGCAGVDWETLYHAVYLMAAQRLDKKGITVRSHQTLDAAADVSVLMSDKTGTITGERMALASFVVGEKRFDFGDAEPQSVHSLLRLATLCCTGSVELVQGEQTVSADPTESAILTAAVRRKMYPDVLQAEYPRLQCVPFTPQRRRMSSLHMIEGKYVLIVKGTAEVIFSLCESGCTQAVLQQAQQLHSEGLRSVAVAYRFLDDIPAELSQEDERQLTLVGLLGLRDIPQDKVMDTVEQCIGADILPLICTGDHPQTAFQMARRLGLVQHPSQVITHEQLQQPLVSLSQVRVCAQPDRKDKLQLLQQWQQSGAAVAVVGSTMQDLALMEQADVAFACVPHAQQPACHAAQVLVQREDLACLARVVRTGRAVYRRLWQVGSFALIALLAVWLINLIGLIWHGNGAVQLWPWFGVMAAQLPLLTVWLACRGKYGWKGKTRDVRAVLLTALIPLVLSLIGMIFAWQVAAFAVGLAVQALVLSRQN